MDEARRQKLAAVRERLTKRLADRVRSEAQDPRLIPVPPRYDEVFYKGTAWLDSLAGGPPVKGTKHYHLCPQCGKRETCDLWSCEERPAPRLCSTCSHELWVEERRRYAGDNPTLQAMVEIEIRQRTDPSFEDEDCEMEALYERRSAEIEGALPRPQCCEALSDTGAIYLRRLLESDDKPEGPEKWERYKPRWRLSFSYQTALRMRERSDSVTPAFCPFCGERLPKVRRKANPPQPLCVIEDGGYCCSTCGEDHRCVCYPPEAAYEVVRDED